MTTEATETLDTLQDEARTTGPEVPEREEGTLEIPLGKSGTILHVRPKLSWRSSDMTALNAGSFEVWARNCLEPESFDDWLDIDPTVGEIMEFFDEWKELDGQSPLSTRPSRRSRRGTRQR
jgi:hypothetical protein